MGRGGTQRTPTGAERAHPLRRQHASLRRRSRRSLAREAEDSQARGTGKTIQLTFEEFLRRVRHPLTATGGASPGLQAGVSRL